MQTADAKSNLQHGGGTLSALGEQQREVHGTERSAQIGHAGAFVMQQTLQASLSQSLPGNYGHRANQ